VRRCRPPRFPVHAGSTGLRVPHPPLRAGHLRPRPGSGPAPGGDSARLVRLRRCEPPGAASPNAPSPTASAEATGDPHLATLTHARRRGASRRLTLEARQQPALTMRVVAGQRLEGRYVAACASAGAAPSSLGLLPFIIVGLAVLLLRGRTWVPHDC